MRNELCLIRQGSGCMDQVFAVRQVCNEYLTNWKDVFWGLWIWKWHMIRFISMVCGRC